jgi:hypothetical protein
MTEVGTRHCSFFYPDTWVLATHYFRSRVESPIHGSLEAAKLLSGLSLKKTKVGQSPSKYDCLSLVLARQELEYWQCSHHWGVLRPLDALDG